MEQFFNQTYLPEAIKSLNHSLFFYKQKNFKKILLLYLNIVNLKKKLLSYVFDKEFDIIVSKHKDLISDLDNLHLNLLSLISLILYEFEDSFYLNRLENQLLEENQDFYFYFEKFLIKMENEYTENDFNKFVLKIIKK